MKKFTNVDSSDVFLLDRYSKQKGKQFINRGVYRGQGRNIIHPISREISYGPITSEISYHGYVISTGATNLIIIQGLISCRALSDFCTKNRMFDQTTIKIHIGHVDELTKPIIINWPNLLINYPDLAIKNLKTLIKIAQYEITKKMFLI